MELWFVTQTKTKAGGGEKVINTSSTNREINRRCTGHHDGNTHDTKLLQYY